MRWVRRELLQKVHTIKQMRRRPSFGCGDKQVLHNKRAQGFHTAKFGRARFIPVISSLIRGYYFSRFLKIDIPKAR